MKYLLFGGQDYYPLGGGHDFIRAGDDLDELKIEAEVFLDEYENDWETPDWCHIFDTKSNSVVIKINKFDGEWKPARKRGAERAPHKQCSEIITVDISGDKGGEG